MSTVPISGVSVSPVPYQRLDGSVSAAVQAGPVPHDSVEISDEARRRARDAYTRSPLPGEVRYDAPHTDDPDFPWEVAHQEWVDLMAKVFNRIGEESERVSAAA